MFNTNRNSLFIKIIYMRNHCYHSFPHVMNLLCRFHITEFTRITSICQPNNNIGFLNILCC